MLDALRALFTSQTRVQDVLKNDVATTRWSFEHVKYCLAFRRVRILTVMILCNIIGMVQKKTAWVVDLDRQTILPAYTRVACLPKSVNSVGFLMPQFIFEYLIYFYTTFCHYTMSYAENILCLDPCFHLVTRFPHYEITLLGNKGPPV